MPVEIRELNISSTVSQSNQPNTSPASISNTDLEKIKREIKKECIEELKQYFKDQTER